MNDEAPLRVVEATECWFVFSKDTTSMNPAGKHISVRILLSTFTTRCMQINFTSLYVSAYFKRWRSSTASGRHSRSLCGPQLGLGAQSPRSLSSIQCDGAYTRLRCFFGPRAIATKKAETATQAPLE